MKNMSAAMTGKARARKGERGVTLISTLIALVIFSISVLAFFQLLTFEAVKAVINDRQRAGLEFVSEKLQTLTALNKTNLPYGGSVTPGAACQDPSGMLYCDRVVRAPRVGAVDPPPQVLPYSTPVPEGSTVIAFRRWLVEPVDDATGLRRITVTASISETAQPYLRRSTQAVVSP